MHLALTPLALDSNSASVKNIKSMVALSKCLCGHNHKFDLCGFLMKAGDVVEQDSAKALAKWAQADPNKPCSRASPSSAPTSSHTTNSFAALDSDSDGESGFVQDVGEDACSTGSCLVTFASAIKGTATINGQLCYSSNSSNLAAAYYSLSSMLSACFYPLETAVHAYTHCNDCLCHSPLPVTSSSTLAHPSMVIADSGAMDHM